MAKRLAVLAGTLALLILGMGLPPALAQGNQYGGGEVSATGYLSPVSPPGSYSHLLSDEATGQQYLVRSGAVDLGAYDDGQKVTVRGTLVSGGGAESVLEVTGIGEPVETPQPGEAATLSFELLVEGTPPAGATFFGNIQTGEGGPGIFVPLTDPDGDGVYAGSTTIPDRFPPGLRPLPPDAEPLAFPIRIVQGTGTNPNAEGELPGEPTTVLQDFGVTPLQESNSFPASVSFGPATGDEHEDGGDPEGGVDLNEDGAVDEADAELAAETSDAAAEEAPEEATLPNTGGAVLPLLAGALLVGGGCLIRRAYR
ncbi:hypothetical protein GBA65_16415 [Rubrobacter marinus]|uniref:Gram-positive cocci surface proteins LPxTG domain-containing protein n=1 Tax=Rubrobacter marinus TaxID=2653852 RepID=A0A6G8Q058_9ACTN|nr:hypothetical protein [Rubrobacter marinus]QIN79851.1 hypothetical protein GBA65_16415 [Rubrobacter marinus]